MKVKVVALLGVPQKTKKEGAGILNICVAYPDGAKGVHALYSDNIGLLHNIKESDVIDVQVKMEEFAFLKAS